MRKTLVVNADEILRKPTATSRLFRIVGKTQPPFFEQLIQSNKQRLQKDTVLEPLIVF